MTSALFDLSASARIHRAVFCHFVSLAVGVLAGSCKYCRALLLGAVPFNTAAVFLKDLMRFMGLTIYSIHSIVKSVVNMNVSYNYWLACVRYLAK